MQFIKSFDNFKESLRIDFALVSVDLNESLGLLYDNILKSINAEEMDIFTTFHLPKDDFADKLNLDLLHSNTEFINSLSSIGLKNTSPVNTEDFETFLSKPCRFLLIYRMEANELENPEYIIFQSWNENLSKWTDSKLYKIKGDIKNFYDKLSSKIIEIEDGGEKYIYGTSNNNEWILQNLEKENDTFKKYFRKDEFEKLINDRKLSINII
jgi:hypothetical protein